MVTLKQACDIVLSEFPHQYIIQVNEFEDEFAFVMMNVGEIGGPSIIVEWPVVMKHDGKLRPAVDFINDEFDRDFLVHTKEEIEELMKKEAS